MSKLKTTLKDPDIDSRLLDERGRTRERMDKAWQSPIDGALIRRQITRAQYAAAQKYYAHWYKSGLSEHFGTIDLERPFGGGSESAGMPKTELQAVHRKQRIAALKALKAWAFPERTDEGIQRAWVLDKIVCSEEPIVNVGYLLGTARRDTARNRALSLLADGLDILCREWHIKST